MESDRTIYASRLELLDICAELEAEIARLRATLTEIRDTARSTYSQQCQWCRTRAHGGHSPDCPAALAEAALEAL